MAPLLQVTGLLALLLAPCSASAGLYGRSSSVLEVDGSNYDQKIKNADKPSIVEFYAPWCGHCQNLKGAYEKVAKSLEGLAQVAAVNCDDDANKAFCGRMGVQGFPTLKTVRISSKGKAITADYNGARSATEIADAVKALIVNNVKRVDDDSLADWLSKKNETAKAILFSDKGATSALIKTLANEFLDSLPVAQVRDKEKAVNKVFGITNYPTLLVLPGGTKDPVIFDGEMKKPAMSDFLKQYGKLKASASTSTSTASKSKATDKARASSESSAFSKASASHASSEASSAAGASASTITIEDADVTPSPDPIVEDAAKPVAVPPVAPPLTHLESKSELQAQCLGPKTPTCILAFLPDTTGAEGVASKDASAALSALAELSQKHQARGTHLFPFFGVPSANAGGEEVKRALELPADATQVIAINGKKKWWRRFDAEKGFGSTAIETWVDSIRFGEGTKEKLPAELIVDEVEAASATSSTSTSSSSTASSEASSDDAKAEEPVIVHEEL